MENNKINWVDSNFKTKLILLNYTVWNINRLDIRDAPCFMVILI